MGGSKVSKACFGAGAAVALLLVLVVQSGVGQAGNGITVVTRTNPVGGGTNSDDFKGDVSLCPEQLQVVGGGARLYGDTVNTLLQLSDPEPGGLQGNIWGTTAKEVTGSDNGAWGLRTDAFCSDSLAVAITDWSSGNDTAASHNATAKCAPGTRVIGGGHEFTTQFGSVDKAVTGSYPVAQTRGGPLDAWRASGRRIGGSSSASWGIQAFAICVARQNVEVGSVQTRPGSTASRTLTSACSDGKTVIGGGARVIGAGPLGSGGQNVGLFVNGPEGSPDAPTKWRGAAHKVGAGQAGAWTLKVWRFCL